MPDILALADKKRRSLASHITAAEHERLIKARRVAIEAAEVYSELVWRAAVEVKRKQRKASK